jgi:histidine triad (HIT) family protein
MAADSIFTKIIRGEIPSHKIYEDDKTFAFLDIRPVQPGHTLIVPKTQIGKFYELSDADLTALFLTAKKVAAHMEKILGKRIIVQIEGFDLPDHTHVKLIPANRGDKLHAEPQPASQDKLAAMADKLRMK